MSVKVVGGSPQTKRIVTGLKTFDMAFENVRGDIGFPVGTMTEISGPTGCGKSTLTFGLSGILARTLDSNIALADFEGFDPDFMVTILENSNFNGTIYHLQDESDEKTLDKLITNLREDCSIGIIDSIGAISPIAEIEGDLGEANMGRRAKLMAQFSRKLMHEIGKDRKRSIFMINHVHPNIGGMGSVTPGGETTKYLSAIRIRVKRKEEIFDQSYVMEGTVTKNRFGYRDRKFYIFMLAGAGIHLGLSALYDCFILQQAERGKVVKMDGKSYGYLKEFLKEAHKGNNDIFLPFIEKLANKSVPKIVVDDREVEPIKEIEEPDYEIEE
jgi:recombination protein RecA